MTSLSRSIQPGLWASMVDGVVASTSSTPLCRSCSKSGCNFSQTAVVRRDGPTRNDSSPSYGVTFRIMKSRTSIAEAHRPDAKSRCVCGCDDWARLSDNTSMTISLSRSTDSQPDRLNRSRPAGLRGRSRRYRLGRLRSPPRGRSRNVVPMLTGHGLSLRSCSARRHTNRRTNAGAAIRIRQVEEWPHGFCAAQYCSRRSFAENGYLSISRLSDNRAGPQSTRQELDSCRCKGCARAIGSARGRRPQ